MGTPWYCSREDVTAALDAAAAARVNAQVDRLIDAASRGIEALCSGRRFYPTKATRYVDWPTCDGDSYRIYLDRDHELWSLTSVTSGGTTITEYFLEPQASGPPYTRLEIDQSGTDVLNVAAGIGQRSIALTGVFGACADTALAGTLTAAVSSTTATTLTVSSGLVGTGALLLIDSEYAQVTGRALADTTVTISGNLTATKNNTSVGVSSAATFAVGEVITIDAERMLITDIAGSTLIVERGWSGSTLAAHSLGAAVYSPRTLTVSRGQCGTTAATHSNGAVVYVHTPPPLVRQLCIAETLNALAQEQSGYARTIGGGDFAREAGGRGLNGLRKQVQNAHAGGLRKNAI